MALCQEEGPNLNVVFTSCNEEMLLTFSLGFIYAAFRYVRFTRCNHHCQDTFIHYLGWLWCYSICPLDDRSESKISVSFCMCSIKKVNKSSCHHDNNDKHCDSGGDYHHESFEKESEDEAALLTAVTSRHVDAEFIPLSSSCPALTLPLWLCLTLVTPQLLFTLPPRFPVVVEGVTQLRLHP